MKKLASNGCGACSPERGRQCPGGQRQGATATARRYEGVGNSLVRGCLGKGAGTKPAPNS